MIERDNPYKGISHFTLKREIFDVPIGAIIAIMLADGRECLRLMNNGAAIELPFDMATRCPEWFEAVYEDDNKNKWASAYAEYVHDPFYVC